MACTPNSCTNRPPAWAVVTTRTMPNRYKTRNTAGRYVAASLDSSRPKNRGTTKIPKRRTDKTEKTILVSEARVSWDSRTAFTAPPRSASSAAASPVDAETASTQEEHDQCSNHIGPAVRRVQRCAYHNEERTQEQKHNRKVDDDGVQRVPGWHWRKLHHNTPPDESRIGLNPARPRIRKSNQATCSYFSFGVKHEGHFVKFNSRVVKPQTGHTNNALLCVPFRWSRSASAAA